MTSYRIYLLDRSGSIEGREEFEAPGDAEAAALGSLLFEACSDVCTGYQVWHGPRCITSWMQGMQGLTNREVGERLQAAARATEELLHNSNQNVARSKRLLQRLNNQVH